jgi:hypothetical protein
MAEPIERWLPVVGYEGLYEVSDHGRVRRVAISWAKRPGKKILRLRRTAKGYLDVELYLHMKRQHLLVHRLVAEAFIGPQPPLEPQINHKDGDKTNNRSSNLEWVTPLGNKRHAIRMGLIARPMRGEDSRSAKLTWPAVEEIRRLYGAMTQAEIAAMFGVSRKAIQDVLHGRTWNR